MDPLTTHRLASLGMIAAAAATVVALRLVVAPYGRHAREGWGPTLPAPVAWALMEAPAPLAFGIVYAGGPHARGAAPLALLALWMAHYLRRAFVYPLTLRGGRPMPVAVALMGAGFNAFNGWLNARQVAALGDYPAAWLADPRLIAGVALFALGEHTNLRADAALRALRAPGERGYKVPRGWLFERVSCPNYLGEIVAWGGWALATWSLPGLAFALFTAANLAPRAAAHHAWYRATFADYPASRRALIPGVW